MSKKSGGHSRQLSALAPFGVTLKTCPNGLAMVINTVGRILRALERAVYLGGERKIMLRRKRPDATGHRQVSSAAGNTTRPRASH